MKKLKLILFFSLIISFIYHFNYKSIYQDKKIITGTVVSVKDNSFIIKNKEKILVKYNDNINAKIGDILKIEGNIELPSKNTIFNLFNYQKYLLSKKIYCIFNIKKITKIKENKNIIYILKNIVYKRLNKINNSYLNTLIIGDNILDKDVYDTYKVNGITHLFAISGMHIALLSGILLYLLNKIFKRKYLSYLITMFFLLIYMLLVGTPSVIRSVLMFSFIFFNRLFKLKFKTKDILIVICLFLLIINPFYIYDVGFLYSFIISYTLIKYNYLFKDKKYIKKIFLISLLSLLASFPITVNNNFEINLFSLISNIFFVPYMSLIIFPLSIMTFIFNSLNPLLNILIKIMEYMSFIFTKFKLVLIFPYMDIYLVIIYYLLLILVLKRINLKRISIFLVYLVFLYNFHLFMYPNYTVLDVGQGDSSLIDYKNNSILIDTGGNKNYDLSKNIISYLKSRGIHKLQFLILTHGDFDHVGSSLNLINNFKIENIIMNSYEDNVLEKEIINLTRKKNIKIYKYSKKKIKIKDIYLYFLNDSNIEENNDSLIIYTKIKNKGILLMGDATKDEERELIKDYVLDVDILKVGHHGSKTSTSKEFIDVIKPRYSVISVGKYNYYGHPNKEVLNNLKKSELLRTDQNGSIRFTFKNNLQIEMCKP